MYRCLYCFEIYGKIGDIRVWPTWPLTDTCVYDKYKVCKYLIGRTWIINSGGATRQCWYPSLNYETYGYKQMRKLEWVYRKTKNKNTAYRYYITIYYIIITLHLFVSYTMFTPYSRVGTLLMCNQYVDFILKFASNKQWRGHRLIIIMMTIITFQSTDDWPSD